MKKFAQKTVLLIAAIAVFMTGAGVTIVNYCCSTYSGQTLLVTQQHVCCGHGHSDKETGSCCSHQGHLLHVDEGEDGVSTDPHCSATRLSMDIDASSFRPHLLTPFVWISDAHFIQHPCLLQHDPEHTATTYYTDSSPDIPPREYLTLLTVLII